MGVLGANTAVVDGQRVTLPPPSAFHVQSFGLQTQGVPVVSPTVPPIIGGTTAGVGSSSGGYGYNTVGDYGTADNNALAAQTAADHPFSLRHSPVLWAVGALVGGLAILQAVNWHETVEESGSVGKTHERASESAGS